MAIVTIVRLYHAHVATHKCQARQASMRRLRLVVLWAPSPSFLVPSSTCSPSSLLRVHPNPSWMTTYTAGRVVDSERGINTKCSSFVWVWRGVRKERRPWVGMRRAGTAFDVCPRQRGGLGEGRWGARNEDDRRVLLCPRPTRILVAPYEGLRFARVMGYDEPVFGARGGRAKGAGHGPHRRPSTVGVFLDAGF